MNGVAPIIAKGSIEWGVWLLAAAVLAHYGMQISVATSFAESVQAGDQAGKKASGSVQA